MCVLFSFFFFDHHDENFIEKEKEEERERERERENEFVKQNSEAQIERNEQTTTSTKRKKTKNRSFLFLYELNTTDNTLVSYKHVFKFAIMKKEFFLSFDNGRRENKTI